MLDRFVNKIQKFIIIYASQDSNELCEIFRDNFYYIIEEIKKLVLSLTSLSPDSYVAFLSLTWQKIILQKDNLHFICIGIDGIK